MIAVFLRSNNDLKHLRFSPSVSFKVIRNTMDVMGAKFTGVIDYADWYENKEAVTAHDMLRKRQPELFKRRLR